MFLHAAHSKNASQYAIVDLETGQEIPRVVWADDETGMYCQNMIDEHGERIVTKEHGRHVFKRRIIQGRIAFKKIT